MNELHRNKAASSPTSKQLHWKTSSNRKASSPERSPGSGPSSFTDFFNRARKSDSFTLSKLLNTKDLSSAPRRANASSLALRAPIGAESKGGSWKISSPFLKDFVAWTPRPHGPICKITNFEGQGLSVKFITLASKKKSPSNARPCTRNFSEIPFRLKIAVILSLCRTQQ